MKYEDWQARFWRAMEESSGQPLVWGEQDCVLFGAKMADAISDGKYTERARAAFAWSNEREAVELIRGGGLRALIESVLGEMQPWTRLAHGDLVLVVDDKQRESLAVHDGCQIIGKSASGVQRIPFRCVQGGWKVD
jgi:hypothetical protein